MELFYVIKNKTIAILIIAVLMFSSFSFVQSTNAMYANKATSSLGVIQTDKSEYDVSYTVGSTVKVNGTVNKPQQGDDKVTVVFRAPDGSTSGSQVSIAWNGFFQTELPLDYNSQKGTYTVFASYATTGIGALSFTVKQVSANTLPNSNQVIHNANQQSNSTNQNKMTQPTAPVISSTPTPQNSVKIQNQISNTNKNQITTSGELKPSDIFSLAKPGTVLIFTIVNSTMKIPVPEFESQKLTDFISTGVNQGILDPNDKQTAIQAAIDEIAKNPDTYLVPTSQYHSGPLSITMEGSGFILNQNGYVVTNAHVLGSDQDITNEFAKQAANAIISYTTTSFSQSTDLTQNQKTEMATAFVEYVVKNIQIGETNKKILALVHDASDQPIPFTLQVMAVGGVIPDKDVAILKMDGNNFSPLPLGNDESLNVGDKLYVLGYPAAATFMPYLSTSSYTEPTFTSGVVSAKKTMAGGWSVVQTDATMTHGNSGGPVFDSSGKVVGIATFVSVDPNTGREVPGLNFVIPVSVVKEFVNNVGTTYIQDYPGMASTGSSNLSQINTSLPHWLKNNAHYWSIGNIGDDDFIKGIQYMIQHKIITIPPATQGTAQTTIPNWVKKDAGWWSIGEMSDDDFIKALQYLVSNGIITP